MFDIFPNLDFLPRQGSGPRRAKIVRTWSLGIAFFEIADGKTEGILVHAVERQRQSTRFPEFKTLWIRLSNQLMLLDADFVFLFLA